MDMVFSKRLNSRYFHNKRGGFFIEAGAMAGAGHSVCQWFEEELYWSGINVEPNPSLFIKLVHNRPNSININYALSDKVGSEVLVIPINNHNIEMRGHGTISDIRAKKFESSRNIKKYTVSTDTYTNIINRMRIEKVDLFVLDVEGHELEVISDFHNSPVLPKVFAVETNKIDKASILKLLMPLGYKLDWFDRNDSYFIKEK